MAFISLARAHIFVFFILAIAGGVFVCFPLSLQALEPYAYAAGIEGYYDFSRLFSLASDLTLPDFGRYHPNHPLGQALAGFAFDSLGIPVLTWMRGINTISALVAGLFLYLLSLRLHLPNRESALAVGLFFASHFTALAVQSGEWHMPALALNLAAMSRLVIYLETAKAGHLYGAAALMAMGVTYHLNAFFILLPVGCMVLFVRQPQKYWAELLMAFSIMFAIVFTVYIAIPWTLFQPDSIADFLRLFFVYKELQPTPYSGMTWITIAVQTFYHGFAFIIPGMQYLTGIVTAFMLFFLAASISFLRVAMISPFQWILCLLPVYWFVGHWFFGVRPDALNGWLFALPYLCILIVAGLCRLHKRIPLLLAVAVTLLFLWNFKHWTLPNYGQRSEGIFLFKGPPDLPKTTPVAFIVHVPPLSFPEIWHAGSVLGLRNQTTFFPCCGEKGYRNRLVDWLMRQGTALIVTDGQFDELEHFIRSQRINIRRISDRTANWSASMTPATVYVPLKGPLRLRKRIVAWQKNRLEDHGR